MAGGRLIMVSPTINYRIEIQFKASHRAPLLKIKQVVKWLRSSSHFHRGRQTKMFQELKLLVELQVLFIKSFNEKHLEFQEFIIFINLWLQKRFYRKISFIYLNSFFFH